MTNTVISQETKEKVFYFFDNCRLYELEWVLAGQQFCAQHGLTEDDFFQLWEEWAEREYREFFK